MCFPLSECLNNSSAHYSLKDVPWQLQITLREMPVYPRSHFICALANGACFLAPVQPSFCKPTSCSMRRDILFWAKYSKVDINWGLQVFSSSPAFRHMSIKKRKCQITNIDAKHLDRKVKRFSWSMWRQKQTVARGPVLPGSRSAYSTRCRANLFHGCSTPREWTSLGRRLATSTWRGEKANAPMKIPNQGY